MADTLANAPFEASLTMTVHRRCASCEAPNPDGKSSCPSCGEAAVPPETIEVPAIAPGFLKRLFGA